MSNTHFDRYAKSTYHYSGTDMQVVWDGSINDIRITIVPSPPSSGSVSYLQNTVDVQSVSSKAYWVKKPIRVQWKPKKPVRVWEPTKPVLSLPDLPVWRNPRPNQSAKSIVRAERSFLARHRKISAIRKRKLERYNRAMGKYAYNYERFLKLKALQVHGILKYQRVRGPTMRLMPMNPYTKLNDFHSDATGSYVSHYDYHYKGKYYEWEQRLSGGLEAFFPRSNEVWATIGSANAKQAAISSATSHALQKVFSKISDQKAHVGNIIAERHQTLELLSEIVRRLAFVLTKAKAKDILRTTERRISSLKGMKENANDTLAYLFGVSPLLNDIFGAVERLAQYNSKSSDFIEVKTKSSGVSSSSDTTYILSSGERIGEIVTRSTFTATCSYVLHYEITNGIGHDLQSIGLVNPAEIAWEVLPWSFVIDWFLPVGSYINSFTADVGMTFKTGTYALAVTEETTITRTYYGKKIVSGDYRSWKTGSVSRTRQVFSKERQVLTSSPSPRFPEFKNPFSMYHITEAVALLLQLKIR